MAISSFAPRLSINRQGKGDLYQQAQVTMSPEQQHAFALARARRAKAESAEIP